MSFEEVILFKRYVAIFLVSLLSIVVYISYDLKSSVINPESSYVFEHLESDVIIKRDKNSSTYVEAESDNDAFFAVGVAHAQDRLWQLQVQRLIIQGRLSEVFGKTMVAEDVRIRTLGIYKSAESSWQHINPKAKQSLTAYKNGINSWIKTNSPLPLEFRLFGVSPEPWTEIDSLAWIKYFALTLGGNAIQELDRFIISNSVSQDKMNSFFSELDGYYTQQLIPDSLSAVVNKTLNDYHQFSSKLKTEGYDIGSNVWVVSGEYTDDGNAIIANDPHLALQIPSIWYNLTIKGENVFAQGMSIVGLPVIVFGKNQHIAWGGAALNADVQDLYVEHLNPHDPNQYKSGNKWLPFIIREEIIRVSKDFPSLIHQDFEPVKLQVRETIRGPVISEIDNISDHVIALKWTGLNPADRTYESFYNLNYARNWGEFRNALAFQSAPTIDFLYADDKGNIGYQAAGDIPLRAAHNGMLPAPGYNLNYAWTGMIPKEEMPHTFNPKEGFLARANNRVKAKSLYFLSNDWAKETRAQRIEALISSAIAKGDKLSIDSMQKIQADEIDEAALEFIRTAKKLSAKHPDLASAMSFIETWDGSMAKGSSEAAIFQNWLRFIRDDIFNDDFSLKWNQEAKNARINFLIQHKPIEDVTALINSDDSHWCDNQDTVSRKESCADILYDALLKALDELDYDTSSNARNITLGEFQTKVLHHITMSDINGMGILFDRHFPSSGSAGSVNMAGNRYDEQDGYIQSWGASFKHIMKVCDDIDCYRYLHSTGQSGNVMSPHYDDLSDAFFKNEYQQTDFSKSQTFVLQSKDKD